MGYRYWISIFVIRYIDVVIHQDDMIILDIDMGYGIWANDMGNNGIDIDIEVEVRRDRVMRAMPCACPRWC
jgi:hypothetical protein